MKKADVNFLSKMQELKLNAQKKILATLLAERQSLENEISQLQDHFKSSKESLESPNYGKYIAMKTQTNNRLISHLDQKIKIAEEEIIELLKGEKQLDIISERIVKIEKQNAEKAQENASEQYSLYKYLK